ncbi:unnamed protein product [Ambrosiozyma monospora]|uniref:ubiquitinyl hydrolase 1 n=1 Tax=Ambrosiozyma monospora TaxID=43982 RepID=A0A9W6YN96_AMBMO|nr:unnamed protein product [Ambrosiozyma monospora]
MTKQKIKSLLELTELTDDLLKDYKGSTAVQYTTKALDCFEVYKKALKKQNKTDEDYEAMVIYYEACSKIVSQIIPGLPDFQSVKKGSLSELYFQLVSLLNKERDGYMQIRNHVKKRSTTSTNGDDLVERFQKLRNSVSSPPHSKSASPSPSPLLKSNGFSKVMTPSRRESHTPVTTVRRVVSSGDATSIGNDASKRLSLKIRSKKPTLDFDRFTKKDYLSIDEITEILEMASNDILIIDIRKSTDFDLDHIRLTDNIIQVEPFSIRDNYTFEDVEHLSLSTNTVEDKKLFAKINQFELVILLDQNSRSARRSLYLNRFMNILKFDNPTKPLKRAPVFLDGGFEEWQHYKAIIKSPLEYSKPVFSRRSSLSLNQREEPPDMMLRRTPSYGDHFSAPISSASPMSSPMPRQYSPLPSTPNHGREISSPVKSFKLDKITKTPTKPNPAYFYNKNPIPTNGTQYSPLLSPPQLVTSSGTFIRASSLPHIPQIPQQQPPSGLMPYTNKTSAASNAEFKKQLMITTGLVNLGNSCYMNSVLQCLTGAVNMTEFFLNGTYRKRINVNSKLGSKGILATEFASFESEMFTHSSQSKPKSITPIRFRKVLASLNSCYRNTDQQDCFEFLNYLLDSLHEDLNQNGNHSKLPELTKDEEEQREKLPIRIASTIEWERYLRTNFSIVVDIFQGQILSQLRCLECGTTSTTYNAFIVQSANVQLNQPSNYVSQDYLRC